MKRFVLRQLSAALCLASVVGLPSEAFASAFQLWEQDGASTGNYHAGYAASAEDASTAWYNPAGIIRFKNQQAVFGATAILSSFKYNGNIAVNGLGGIPLPVTAQGGAFSLVPALHYVAPITDRIGFGFSVDVPFGLKTNYGRTSVLRYAATLTSVTIIDISPSLAFKVTDKASLGAGFDIQKGSAEFDNVATVLTPLADSLGRNIATDTGYGYHLGGLYQFTPDTRVGLSYHSQVVHHFSGSSKFTGPLATKFNFGPIDTKRLTTNVTLPPYTALSAYSKVWPQVALMGSVIYTQWNTFQTLALNQVAGLVPGGPFQLMPSGRIAVRIPEDYRNTWNLTVGADYFVNDQITLRSGLGFDQTPVRNATRNVQLPDNNRYVIALGGHFQAWKVVGFDLGWTHFFFAQARVHPPLQITGAQVVSTNGHVNGGADVFSGQVVWDMI